MKVWMILISLAVISPALARNVTCTADVPTDTCKKVSALFAAYQKSQIVVAGPASFRREHESLADRTKNPFVLKELGGPIIPNSHNENILFERDDNKTCPTRVVISTDAFRPLNIKEERKGEVTELTSEYVAGFDSTTVLPVLTYVRGFVKGCQMGVATHLADETKKLRGPK